MDISGTGTYLAGAVSLPLQIFCLSLHAVGVSLAVWVPVSLA